jgi:GR25 family glycosyltransferase involved in LPS biosynthesis
MVEVINVKIADIGYYINLDKRTDRREKIEFQFKELHIFGVDRFSAYDKYSSGPMNCKKSHYLLYEELLKTDFESLLVLEDDCLFLDYFEENYESIFEEINNTEWDLFWLGCRNRRWPLHYKGNCYKVSSVSHTQSYIIKKKFCKLLLDTYPIEKYVTTAIDELLCLSIYGEDVVRDPNKYNFYNLDQPLDVLPTNYISLCYEKPLTTQYASYSDLWSTNVDYEKYIANSFPTKND